MEQIHKIGSLPKLKNISQNKVVQCRTYTAIECVEEGGFMVEQKGVYHKEDTWAQFGNLRDSWEIVKQENLLFFQRVKIVPEPLKCIV